MTLRRAESAMKLQTRRVRKRIFKANVGAVKAICGVELSDIFSLRKDDIYALSAESAVDFQSRTAPLGTISGLATEARDQRLTLYKAAP